MGNRADASGPTTGLDQAVEEHENQEGSEGVGESEDYVNAYRQTKAAQEQEPWAPASPDETIDKHAEHVSHKKRRPDVGGVAEFPVQIFGNGCLANRKGFTRQIVPAIGQVAGGEDAPAPGHLRRRQSVQARHGHMVLPIRLRTAQTTSAFDKIIQRLS